MVDYRVWVDAGARPVEEWAAIIQSTIVEAVQDGFVLLFLSEASLQSQFEHFALPRERQSIQHFDLTTGPFEERVEALIRSLRIREME
jgi:hypothetical protein